MQRVVRISSHLLAAAPTEEGRGEGTPYPSAANFDKSWQPNNKAKKGQTIGTVGVKGADDVVIVSAFRTAMGKANKGSFKDTPPENLLIPVLAACCEKVGVDKKEVDDIVVGNCNPNSFAGSAVSKFMAGFGEGVTWQTVNRACSSGLSSILSIAGEIRAGVIDVGIGAGVERMTPVEGIDTGSVGKPLIQQTEPDYGDVTNPEIFDSPMAKDTLIPMGITSENVAARYGITRQEQDELGLASMQKAAAAQAAGWFDSEIVPVTTKVKDAEGKMQTVTVTKDEGIRNTSIDALAKLQPVFKAGGTTTAGNASQTTDGAAACLLMRRSKADELKIPVLASLRATALIGVPPDVMGIGPAYAIPEVLTKAGLKVEDIGVFEVNEAFASQAEYTRRYVGIPKEKLNPVGGAIALGHPLGATGSRQVASLLPQLKRTNEKFGITSMCMGTGMGMAALWENEQ